MTARPGTIDIHDVVASLSYALDLVEGQPEGHALRTCMLGMRLGEQLALDSEARSALFYALLLKDLGCASNAAKVCYLFGGDEHAVKRDFKTTNWNRLSETAAYVFRNVSVSGSVRERVTRVCRLVFRGQNHARELVQIRCDRGASIARFLGLPEETCEAIRRLDEHWDGSGHPDGYRGTGIPLLARILSVAQTTDVFVSRDGVAAAMDVARRRSGTWFDPDVVRALESLESDERLWTDLSAVDQRRLLEEFQPATVFLRNDDATLDRVCQAFAQVVDSKSPWTGRHSQRVADIAAGMADERGFGVAECRTLYRAGLLHDIGKLGVPNCVLDKAGPLTDEEFAHMRRHPLYSQQILDRVPCFEEVVDLAAHHHEKLDGSGYPFGVTGERLSASARILIVADMYEALTASRPYREAMDVERVHRIFDEAAGRTLCADAVEALWRTVGSAESARDAA